LTRQPFLLSLLLVGCQSTARAPDLALGERMFRDTPTHAARFVPTCKLSCVHCHRGLPLGGVAARYPAFNPRAGRQFTLEDRITECFKRSQNGTAPPSGSVEMEALKGYLASLPAGSPSASPPARLPLEQLSAERGAAHYKLKCVSCHQLDGAGFGPYPPLWGPASYNDGAGMGNVYKLSNFIQANMPVGSEHTLTQQEAGDLALFIDSQPRPVFPGKAEDFPGASPPPGSVYYQQEKDRESPE